VPKHNLAQILSAHAGFRQEFELLARAAETAETAKHQRLLDDQIEMVLTFLRKHHMWEDMELWPLLRARAPHAVSELDELEVDHKQLDQLVDRAGDAGLPRREQAAALRQLGRTLTAHLDSEERIALPLVCEYLTVQEWDEAHQRALASMPKRRLATISGWIHSAVDKDLEERGWEGVPTIMRMAFHLFWWPAYKRRARRLYGSFAPTTITGSRVGTVN
jgi:hypothetical protein